MNTSPETKYCFDCIFLKKYTSGDGMSWINVCEGEIADKQEDGLYLITAVDVGVFDASGCSLFKSKNEPKDCDDLPRKTCRNS